MVRHWIISVKGNAQVSGLWNTEHIVVLKGGLWLARKFKHLDWIF